MAERCKRVLSFEGALGGADGLYKQIFCSRVKLPRPTTGTTPKLRYASAGRRGTRER